MREPNMEAVNGVLSREVRKLQEELKAADGRIRRLEAALKGMVDNACAACDEDYVIRATKAEWDAHVKATAQARSALEGEQ